LLRSFLSGTLAELDIDALVDHLAECERCASSLPELERQDAIIADLRKHLRVDDSGRLEDQVGDDSHTPTVLAFLARYPGPANLALAGREIAGRYRVLEQIGVGGMGVVYKALDLRSSRLVAVKVVRGGWLSDEQVRRRFRTEAKAVARLKHSQIVPVYEYDELDGTPYVAMELVTGGNLAETLDGKPLPDLKAAELVEGLARAVQFAHEQRVLHRDLKPANVLLDHDGTAKLSDFGLAKLLDADSGQTKSDAIMGTPSYMAPEQARGDMKNVREAADVYSLGAILYECLTGQPPFRGATKLETLDLVRSKEPKPPSLLRGDLSPILESICLRCLQKEPSSRYNSAAALADDLR
jgi:serine/threonine-protein kinase